LLWMKFELEAVYEEREYELLELLRRFNFGVIGCNGVDVVSLVIDPTGTSGHAVIVRTECDADKSSYRGSGGNETSAGKDAPVGRFVTGGPVCADGSNLKSQGWQFGWRLSLGWSR
jgi:hypothetical protein